MAFCLHGLSSSPKSFLCTVYHRSNVAPPLLLLLKVGMGPRADDPALPTLVVVDSFALVSPPTACDGGSLLTVTQHLVSFTEGFGWRLVLTWSVLQTTPLTAPLTVLVADCM